MHGIRQHGLARSFYEECLDASAALEALGYGLDTGWLLGVYPFGTRNPYLRALYSAALEQGFACLPLKGLEQLNNVPKPLNVALHLHWIHRIYHGLETAKQAAVAGADFLELIQQQKDMGRPILWTIHNIMSHRSAFPEEEIALRARFAVLADHIHIMNPGTVDLCAPHYEVPVDKTFSVPHPSYKGVYGDYISKPQARLSLGIGCADKVFLLFGELGTYKGTRQFLAAVDALQTSVGGGAKVIVAGKAGEPAFMEDIFQLTAGRADVQLHLGHIDDQDVQTFFRAADVAVCAHPSGLNSGVAAMAATFGRPAVMPHALTPTIAGPEGSVYGFDSDNMDTCVAACAAAYSAEQSASTEQGLFEWAEAHAPRKVSADFFSSLRARL
ncbi:MAG: hypothetical protein COB37_07510 [Kordiimonadales bacterium]|nr:MAG: hypothetical protein COB37_07510 [Kordiimonadales bacterium]